MTAGCPAVLQGFGAYRQAGIVALGVSRVAEKVKSGIMETTKNTTPKNRTLAAKDDGSCGHLGEK